MLPLPPLDVSQRAVLDLPDGASAAVLGAPGSGRTTTALALVADRIATGRLQPEEVLLLAPRRVLAGRLRDRLLLEVGRPVTAPLARTPASLAADIARRDAVADRRPPPRLLSGAEQDTLIAQLLPGADAPWPDALNEEVRATATFRAELREVLARCTERDVDPAALDALGREASRPAWIAVADFWRSYLGVLPDVHPDAFDSAELVALATAAVLRGRPGALAGALRLVVVDDLQDMGESVVGLLAALASRGAAVIAFGDPDVASDGFRGGEPDLLGRFGERLGLPRAHHLGLGTVHRHPESVRRFVTRVTERIGTALAGPQRTARAAAAGGSPVLTVEADGPGALAARIAHLLRSRHLDADVPFADQAVVVRSGSLVEPLARALEIAGVPAVTGGSGQQRVDGAARALLETVALALGLVPLTPDSAAALLTGPLCGLDGLALRRLRLALRVEELGGGGTRPSGELLVEALSAPGRLLTIDAAYARRAARLAETLQRVRDLDARDASAEELLWHVWEASGLASAWRERALGDGIAAAEADRDLDGLTALFGAAARAAERGPTDPAAGFLTGRLEADVADDSLAPRGARDGVLVTTPVGVAGREFDTVVIAGLQDGIWPDLRPRGSLLGLGGLIARLDGRDGGTTAVDERRAVLSDELRLFALAASRARSQLVLAAVANDDEAPSVLLGLGDAPAPDAGAEAPNALRPLTGLLRRLVVTETGAARAEAAAALARLARAQVPGAAPASWWGIAPPSTTEPLVPDPAEPVAVSPSALGRFEESPIDWFVDRVAGGEPMLSSAVGTMLHQVLETAGSPDAAVMLAALDGRWHELPFGSAWVGARERRIADRMVGQIARYLGDLERDGSTLVGGETRFELRCGRALARGTIDRVERRADGGVRVVDLKTGSTRPAKHELPGHAQLGVYQLAVRAGAVGGVANGTPSGGASLLFVRSPAGGRYSLLDQAALDDDAAEAFRARLVAAAEGMAAAAFTGPAERESRFGGSLLRPMLPRVPEVCGG